MVSTFFGLEIAKRGINANRIGLDVTGHNITNVNTEGYSRQTIVSVTTASLFEPSMHGVYGAGQIGTGVDVSEIRRYRDAFLDLNYRKEIRTLGAWSVKSDTLQRLQSLLAESDNKGLASVLDQFWEAWEDVTPNTDSPPAARAVVIERGKALVETLKHISRQLDQIESSLNDRLAQMVYDINSYGRQIASINSQIQRIESGNPDKSILGGHRQNANDLRDQRDILLDKLAKLVDITVSEDASGMVSVSAGNGTLVDGVSFRTLTYYDAPDANNKALYEIKWDTGQSAYFNAGELQGILESRGSLVPPGKETTLFGSDKFDWQISANAGSLNIEKLSSLHLTSAAPAGNYRFTIGSEWKPVSATLFLPAKGLPLATASTITMGYGGKSFNIFLNKNDDVGSFINKVNAFTRESGIQARLAKTASAGGLQVIFNTVKDVSASGVFTLGTFPSPPVVSAAWTPMANITVSNGQNAVISVASSSVLGTMTTTVVGSRVTVMQEGKERMVFDAAAMAPFSPIWEGAPAGAYEFQITKREGLIQDARRRLNELALVVVRSVNEVHMAGVSEADLRKDPTMARSDRKFFVDNADKISNPKRIDSIEINPELTASTLACSQPSRTSSDKGTTVVGDNRNALALANLKYEKIRDFLNPMTYDDFYRNVVGDLGVAGQEAKRMHDNQTVLTDTIDKQRQSISSVSLDEEMTNMIRYQQAYNASARMVNVMDEMLDTIIHRLGIVGR
ncbi:flagellar hook-associated protein flgk, putative [Heliomicrobium modesticaldum Ice1]|uniref:Flagellar hook-associated protein 1 n=1 Tax=Heliobacterium modesticaldum (strain ATCC 51547 / Ice1) TaxID=498761 RepID=B0TH44_HELMI|nr:flagellar hook-associated protein FlgK [Heliomicrobium modesticaldum]ABZ83369.1 flagellar hook-associated protein flgk, putative [Heliomicrobium modesticaldum Ice1]